MSLQEHGGGPVRAGRRAPAPGAAVMDTYLQLLLSPEFRCLCSPAPGPWLWKHWPKGLDLPWRVLSWTRLPLQLPPIPSAGATLPLGPWGGWLPQPSCCHRQLKPLNMTAGFQSEIPASNQVNNCTCHIYLLPPIILCCPFWFGHEWLFNIYFLTLVAHNKVIVQLLQP